MPLESLRPYLVEKIRTGCPASELLLRFHKTYKLSSQSVRRGCFHLFLCSAVKHNRTDLVRLLLANTGCVLDTVLQSNIRSLFNAIRSGDVVLVKNILQYSSSSLDVLERYCVNPHCWCINIKARRLRTCKNRTFMPIQYACLCDHREVLKLLVTYDMDQHRDVSRNSSLPASALHTVIDFLSNDRFKKMLTFPAIVQLILDVKPAEGGVQSLIRFNALRCLIRKVKDIAASENDVSSEERCMIVKTARILLHTESVVTPKQKFTLLDSLLEFRWIVSSLGSAATLLHENHLRLVTDLIKLLLTHYGKVQMDVVQRQHFYVRVLWMGLAINCVGKKAIDIIRARNSGTIIDILANIYNYFLLSDAGIMDMLERPSRNATVLYFAQLVNVGIHYPDKHLRRLFDWAFVRIASYSSQQGHSDKYLRMMMFHMNANELRQLRMRLETEETYRETTRDTERNRTHFSAETALKYIRAVEVPLSLQHLSRRAVTRAMSYRCLDAQMVSTLGLPKPLEEYLLPYVHS